MDNIRIGVLCPSEIAFRRFMPALKKTANFSYVGLAAATEDEFYGNGSNNIVASELEKANNFISAHGGKLFSGYESLVSSDEIDAVYIPLPPALHYKWAKAALENGKHVLLEKPFTTDVNDTKALIDIANERQLAVHENYMFAYHSQLEWIIKKIADGAIGDVRLIRIDFGFPFRGGNDFRYNKALGGGALLDCGGYTVKLAGMLLGDSARVVTSQLNSKDGFEVDIYGSATLVNDDGLTAQISFGMDNSYKCSLEVWGSTGTLFTGRVLTAPDGFEPTVTIKTADGEETFTLPADDTFKKSIEYFGNCVNDASLRVKHYDEIIKQSQQINLIQKVEK
ncbi:MAG: Gfo/Idh/MocA family oxidoreductase [Acutalibacteraceae bacterium]|nr:Gfo/Idh/MocA family oxidoreductase [Acutalibacteraceae bacterium]